MPNDRQSYPAIYTEEHLFQCNQALQNCAVTREQIQKLKRIGLQVDDLDNDNEQQHATLLRWKREYFPNAP
jgi:hypothetical protein